MHSEKRLIWNSMTYLIQLVYLLFLIVNLVLQLPPEYLASLGITVPSTSKKSAADANQEEEEEEEEDSEDSEDDEDSEDEPHNRPSSVCTSLFMCVSFY